MREVEKNRVVITRFYENITLRIQRYTHTCNIHMYVCVCARAQHTHVCIAYILLITLAIKEQFVHILLDIVSIHIWSPKDCKYVYLVNY